MQNPVSQNSSAHQERFTLLAQAPDGEVDLALGALLIAAEHRPNLDIEAYLNELDALAGAAEPLLALAQSEADTVSRLNHFLFEEVGFRGNQENYYDPRNSYLDKVLDRRLGIPITLSVVYMEIGRRLGYAVHGIGFPGHFLVRFEGKRNFIVDPFHGRILDHDECLRRLQSILGESATLSPEHFRRSPTKQILARILSNLKQIFLNTEDLQSALSCSNRILQLAPEAWGELRDRGLLYEKLECFQSASQDLERFLANAPEDPSCQLIRLRLRQMGDRVGALH